MKKEIIIKKATDLRKKGFSLREISEKLDIAKSTTSLWLRDIKLSKRAQKRIENLRLEGRKSSKESVKKRISEENKKIKLAVKNIAGSCHFLKNDLKVICALLYWCEGGKTGRGKMTFTNSDPDLVKFFVDTFRKSFDVDKKRFRALIHVHEYHDIEKQTKFWSKITGISKNQFTKPFLKAHTGKRIKPDYQGCVSVIYYGREIMKEVLFLVEEISKK